MHESAQETATYAPGQHQASNTDYLVYGQVAEEVNACLRDGREPDVDSLVADHPELATQLREMVGALIMLHRLGQSPAGGQDAVASFDTPAPLFGRLGDFRISQEIGRGGMGIVYEAEQISLGRRVALKVLPFTAAVDPRQRQRFKIEAHAAAHLHHQHIVPVYAEGCERGVHYYAMQYIEGQTLAALIRELRRMAGLQAAEQAGSAVSASALASELMSGRWAPAKSSSGGVERSRDPEQPTSPYPASAPPLEVSPPAGALSTERSANSPAFFRTVAHLGVQAAEALEHAHTQGIIHRDIKPANLLVDVRGNVWITDFGLARMLSEVGLTMTGDLVGTLRYMSPEQALAKRAPLDHRTDIYSLGVTLYELLTLRPAIDGRDRQEVLQQIAFEEPLLPRRLNKTIPVELDTIVCKAMSKNPAERYATAQELADDLRRFLDDEPIRAKRPTLLDWIRKWARRHPGVVATGISGLLLAVVILAVSTLMILSAYRTAETNLYHARVGQARALRQARGVGYRGRAFELLKQALRLHSVEKNLLELRNEAVACMGDFVGLNPTTWDGFPAEVLSMALQPQGVQIALGFSNGTVWMRDRTTGADIAPLPGHRAAVVGLDFTADGQRMVSGDRDGRIQVWQARPGGAWICQRVIQIDPPTRMSTGLLGPIIAVALSPDGSYLAACSSDQALISVWSLAAEVPPTKLRGRGQEDLRCLAFSPDGRLLAAGYHRPGAHGILVWDVASRQLKPEIRSPFAVTQVAFSRDGQVLGAACTARGIALFDTSTFQPGPYMRGDCTFGVAFSPDSQLIATPGVHGGVITLWDLSRNREVARLQHANQVHLVAFSTDGTALVTANADSVRIWNLVGPPEKMTFSGHDAGIAGLAFSPNGRLLASAGNDGVVKIWNPATGAVVHRFTGFRDYPEPIAFSPDSRMVATGDKAGTVRIWDLESGKELPVPAPKLGRQIDAVVFSPNGKYFVAGGGVEGPGEPGGVVLWHRGAGGSVLEKPVRLSSAPLTAVGALRFSDDSRLLAWLESASRPLRIWDIENVREYPAPKVQAWGDLGFAFGRNEHLVVIGDKGVPEMWEVTTGKRVFAFEGRESAMTSHLCTLSADGTWLAQSASAPRVWDLKSRTLLFTFPEERTYPWSLAWSPNKELLAIGWPSGELVVWNLPEIKTQLNELGLGW